MKVEIALNTRGETIVGTAKLEGCGEPIGAEARAVRHADGSNDAWASDLVIARLLRQLEVALMESVYERVDRAIRNE